MFKERELKQVLTVGADEFSIFTGSRISLDGDHLKCDNYAFSDSESVTIKSMVRRSDGGIRTISGAWQLGRFNSDLEHIDTKTFEDLESGWIWGLGIDDEDKLWVGTNQYPRDLQRYNDDGSLIGSYDLGGGKGKWRGIYQNPADGYIYACDLQNHKIQVCTKAGVYVKTITPNKTYPSCINFKGSNIFTHEYLTIQKYDSDFNFIESIVNSQTETTTIPQNAWRYYIKGMVVNSDGHFLVYGMHDQFDILVELDSLGDFLRTIASWKRGESGKGLVACDYNQWCDTLVLSSDEKTLYVANQYAFVSGGNGTIIAFDLRDCTERYATYQKDFGSSVPIERLHLNGLFDSRDTDWQNVRLWYQLDGEGWNEVDLTNPVINASGQVLDLKIGMQTYGFVRYWPKIYSVDIVYDDGTTAKVAYPLKGIITEKQQLKGIVTEKLEIKGVIYVKD